MKATPNAPPSKTPSEGSSTDGMLHLGITEEAFAEAHLRCIAEFKASKAFKGELLNVSMIGFV